MGKITKKSINTLLDLYKRGSIDTVLNLTDPQDDNSVIMEIALKTSMTIPEKGMFVDRVVNSCFDADGDYMPQYFKPVFAITLLQMTTNVPVFETSVILTKEDGTRYEEKGGLVDIEKTYELCRAINLEDRIKDTDYINLIHELREMAMDKLEYMKQVNMRKISNSLTILKPVLDEIQRISANPDFINLVERLSRSTVTDTVKSDNKVDLSDNVISFSDKK